MTDTHLCRITICMNLDTLRFVRFIHAPKKRVSIPAGFTRCGRSFLCERSRLPLQPNPNMTDVYL